MAKKHTAKLTFHLGAHGSMLDLRLTLGFGRGI